MIAETQHHFSVEVCLWSQAAKVTIAGQNRLSSGKYAFSPTIVHALLVHAVLGCFSADQALQESKQAGR